MTIVVPNVGENIALEYLVNKDAPENLVYGLYVNDLTPAESDDDTDYTACTETGYSAKTLTGASWNAASGGSIDYAQQTWTFTGTPPAGQTIYGYYVTRAVGGELVLAERASTPFTVTNENDQVLLTPTITAD